VQAASDAYHNNVRQYGDLEARRERRQCSYAAINPRTIAVMNDYIAEVKGASLLRHSRG